MIVNDCSPTLQELAFDRAMGLGRMAAAYTSENGMRPHCILLTKAVIRHFFDEVPKHILGLHVFVGLDNLKPNIVLFNRKKDEHDNPTPQRR